MILKCYYLVSDLDEENEDCDDKQIANDSDSRRDDVDDLCIRKSERSKAAV